MEAMQFCQIDACRLGGVNENLAVILMAAKFDGKCTVFKSFFQLDPHCFLFEELKRNIRKGNELLINEDVIVISCVQKFTAQSFFETRH